MPDQPNSLEPVPVQLTRIEGTVNLIAYQMAEVKDDIKGVKVDLVSLTGRVSAVEMAQAATADVNSLCDRINALERLQAAASGTSAFLKSWLPTIIAAAGVAAAYGFGVKFGG